MGEGIQFLDIILLAMVAAFIILRLRSVLGRKSGNEHSGGGMFPRSANGHDKSYDRDEAASDNVVRIPHRHDRPGARIDSSSPFAEQFQAMQSVDRSFDPEMFREGAVGAYEEIVTAFARGDRDTLKPLLSEDVYDGFEEVISARDETGEEMTAEVVSIKSTDFEDVQLDGNEAEITIKFVSEMILFVKNADGAVISGDVHPSEKTDIWTFRRDLKSSDPTWFLTNTRSLG